MVVTRTDDALKCLDSLFRVGTLRELSDGELITRFVAGSDASMYFAELVDRHGPMVLRLCRRVLKSPQDAEDASQAAFLVLARRARTIRKCESLGSWLFGTAFRIARRARRSAARQRQLERQGAEMAPKCHMESQDASRDDTWSELYAELDRLSEILRGPLVLCYLEGLTNEQAAQRLRLPVRTIQRRLAQGRDRLRARLVRRGVAPVMGLLAASLSTDAATAELPAVWAVNTVHAAVQIVVQGNASGVASLGALTMMEGLMGAILDAKLKVAALTVLLTGVMLLGLLPLARGQRTAAVGLTKEPMSTARIAQAKPAVTQAKPCEVIVIAKDTGKPLVGAICCYLIDLEKVETTTNDQGEATLLLDRQTFGRGSLSLDVWADGYVQQRYSFSNADKRLEPVPERLKVELFRGTETFGGVVKDEAGQPIAGATVALWGYLDKKEDSRELVYMVRSTSDAQGRWRNSSLRPMRFIYLYVSHTDFLSDDDLHVRAVGQPNGSTIPSFADLRALKREDVMARGVEIRGRVLDEEGKPLVGATVGWVADHNTFFDKMAKTVTDGAGQYRFQNARPGTVAIVAKTKGREPELKEIDAAPGMDAIDFRLGAGKPLLGRVVDDQGKPVVGAFVNIDTWRRYRCLGVFLSTDGDGRFSWVEAPSDEVLINASKAGYLPVFQQRVRADGSEVKLTLMPSLEISGTIKDAETGKRIENPSIESGVVDPVTGEVGWSKNPKVFAISGHLQASLNAANAKAFKIRVGAGGYETVVSPEFRVADGNATFNVELKKAKTGTGMVLGPEGQPIAGATVILLRRQGGLHLRAGKAQTGGQGGPLTATTEPDGTFSLPTNEDQYVLVAAHDRYYGDCTKEQFEKAHELRVAPWGRLVGTLKIGSKLGAGVKVELNSEPSDRFPGIDISSKDEKTTDGEGRFVFEKVVPGAVRISRRISQGMDRDSWDLGRLFSVKAGETTESQVGGLGRPVIGQLAAPQGMATPRGFFRDYEIQLESNRAYFPYPLELIRNGQWSDWGHGWRESEEGRAYLRDYTSRTLRADENGSFRLDDVPEGVYQVHARPRQAVEMKRAGKEHTLAPTFYQTLVVPPVAGGQSDEPIHLGQCSMWIQKSPEVGDPAPDFKVTTLDGREISLADYRGHFVLLDFGAPSSRQSRHQVSRLGNLAAQFGKDERLVILSVTVDRDTPETRTYIVEKHQSWRQAIIGSLSPENMMARSYDIGMGELDPNRLPREYLINPDGKLIAKDLGADKLNAAVANALEKR
jgi:RNA polymerase sigma factor (sigma-70 family)